MRSMSMQPDENRKPADGVSTERTVGAWFWRVLRVDDNGNRFVVAECATEDEARRIADAFTARGHKQTYWVECDGEDGEGDGR